jgi:hypothetical protein
MLCSPVDFHHTPWHYIPEDWTPYWIVCWTRVQFLFNRSWKLTLTCLISTFVIIQWVLNWKINLLWSNMAYFKKIIVQSWYCSMTFCRNSENVISLCMEQSDVIEDSLSCSAFDSGNRSPVTAVLSKCYSLKSWTEIERKVLIFNRNLFGGILKTWGTSTYIDIHFDIISSLICRLIFFSFIHNLFDS